MIGSTMMAALFERDDLKEHEYFGHLGKASGWELNGSRLELYSAGDSGAETVLVFTEQN